MAFISSGNILLLCELLLLNYLDFFYTWGKKLFQFVFSIILCIFVTALFSGYTDYFHYARSFFVCVSEYNHNFVCKTYFCELRYWWKVYLQVLWNIVQVKFSNTKNKKKTHFLAEEFKYLLTPNLKNKPIRYWYNFGHFILVWNRSTFVFCCLINIKLKFSILL